jgi:hypothetical protein
LLLPLCLSVEALATGVLVTPGQMGLSARPGETARGIFQVSAAQREKTLVRITVKDYDKTPDNKTVEGEAGRTPRSCATWTRLEPVLLETAEEGWSPVQVFVAVPPDARGTYWAMVAFEVEPPAPKPGTGARLAIRPRITLPLLVTVEGTEIRSARILGSRATLKADGSVEASAEIENLGTTGLMLSGSWVLESVARPGETPEELHEHAVNGFLVLPGHRLTRTEVLKPEPAVVPPASAHVYLRYGMAPGEIVEATVPLEGNRTATPPPQPTPTPPAKGTPVGSGRDAP